MIRQFATGENREKCDDLAVVAERLRRFLTGCQFRIPDERPLVRTGSIGFCMYPFQRLAPFEFSWEQVLALADAALYLAKQEGRNRAVDVTAGNRFSYRPADFFDICLRDLAAGEKESCIRLLRVLPPKDA